MINRSLKVSFFCQNRCFCRSGRHSKKLQQKNYLGILLSSTNTKPIVNIFEQPIPSNASIKHLNVVPELFVSSLINRLVSILSPLSYSKFMKYGSMAGGSRLWLNFFLWRHFYRKVVALSKSSKVAQFYTYLGL